ncbi:MAG: hypothetical protein HDR30_03085 [Lachnospiraceae bacterium]|nr:hypothetical protein [Lachnospiraceae bacterium]
MEELLKEMKKKSIGNVMPISVILLIAAVVMLIINGTASLQLFAYLTGGKNLDSIPKSEMNDVIAGSEINVVYDCFAEYETSEGKIYDYYVIPYGEEDFMAVCVGESKIAQMDSICDDTWEVLLGNSESLDKTVSVKGNVRAMDGDELYYYKEWFRAMEYSDDEMAEYALNYVLEDGMFANSIGPARLYVMTAISLILIIVAIYLLIKAFLGGYLKEIKKDFEQSGLSESQIVSDYQSANVISKNIRIGRLFTYNAVSTSPRVYLNKNMAWAYLYRTKHYRNGIYTGSSYNVLIFEANGTNQIADIAVKKKFSEQILEYYANNFPHMVVGYSDDLKNLYHNDHNAFLALKYQQAQDMLNY